MEAETHAKTLFERIRENPLLVCIGVLLGLLSSLNSIGILQSANEWLGFKMIQAEINSYREYPDVVKCSPQVAAVIAQWNARIAHEHEARRHWWSWPMSPYWWKDVKEIDMKCTTGI
jgi:hypothetical protein